MQIEVDMLASWVGHIAVDRNRDEKALLAPFR
jgi:hypothetical protein